MKVFTIDDIILESQRSFSLLVRSELRIEREHGSHLQNDWFSLLIGFLLGTTCSGGGRPGADLVQILVQLGAMDCIFRAVWCSSVAVLP